MSTKFEEQQIAIWRQPEVNEPLDVRIIRALPGNRYLVEFPLNPAARARQLLAEGNLSPAEEAIARNIIAEREAADRLLGEAEEMPVDGPFVVGGSELSLPG